MPDGAIKKINHISKFSPHSFISTSGDEQMYFINMVKGSSAKRTKVEKQKFNK